MDDRELREIETMHAQGGILPADVGRMLAEVRRLQAENAALRARAVPAVAWIRENGESAADHGCFRLEVWQRGADRWWVSVGRDLVRSGTADSQADGEAKAERALLVACGCKS